MRPTGGSATVVWLIVAQAIGLSATLAGTRVLTERVPPAAYGAFSLCMLVNLLVGNALGQGIVQGAIARVAAGGPAPAATWPRFLVAGIAVSLVLAAAVLAGTGTLSAWWPLLPASAVLIAADYRMRLAIGLLNAQGRQRAFAIWSALAQPVQVWCGIAAVALAPAGPVPLVLGASIGASALAISQRLCLGAMGPAQPALADGDPGTAALLAMAPATVLAWVLTSGERYLIAGMLGIDAVGIYAAGYALVTRPIMVFCSSVALPIARPDYYRLGSQDPAAAGRRLAMQAAAAAGAVAVGVALLTLALPWVLPVLLAPAYHGCRVVIPWIGVAYAAWTLTQFAELPHFRAGRMDGLLPRYACGVVIGAAAVACGCAAGGLVGAAIGVVVGMGSTLALLAWRRP